MDQIDSQEASIPQEKPQASQIDILKKILGDEEKAEFAHQKLSELQQNEFKGSKAVDGMGELAIVWHGTPRIFEQFDPSARGDFRWRNKGVHFATEKGNLTTYAEKANNDLYIAIDRIGAKTIANYDYSNSKHFHQAVEEYNSLIDDLMQNGENSKYFHKHEEHETIDYKGAGMDFAWFSEIFGGQLPTKENSHKVKASDEEYVYFGKDVGEAYYAVVLNIQNPFNLSADTTLDKFNQGYSLDSGFTLGENSHENQGTDGTIIHLNISSTNNSGQKIIETLDSFAVFDPNKVKIVGREINGTFELMPEFTKPQ